MHAYRSLSGLPAAPDLAVVCTPAAAVPGVIAELGSMGTKAAIVLTAGLGKPEVDFDQLARPAAA